MKNLIVGSLVALAAAAGTAQAATVNVTGSLATNANSGVSVLSMGGTTGTTFSASNANASVTGIIAASSVLINGQLTLELRLTGFNYTSSGDGSITVTVSQDYDCGSPSGPATASHQFNGNTTGTRNGSVSLASNHESTALPNISTNFTGTQTISAGQGATTIVPITGNIYSIVATYVFTFSGGQGSGSIILPDSGHDDTLIVLVPLPPAAYAGMGGLALAGFAAFRRRSQNRA
ncbi:MAG: hypothetical protein U0637_04770 [Phycisphaerales bacterium]